MVQLFNSTSFEDEPFLNELDAIYFKPNFNACIYEKYL